MRHGSSSLDPSPSCRYFSWIAFRKFSNNGGYKRSVSFMTFQRYTHLLKLSKVSFASSSSSFHFPNSSIISARNFAQISGLRDNS